MEKHFTFTTTTTKGKKLISPFIFPEEKAKSLVIFSKKHFKVTRGNKETEYEIEEVKSDEIDNFLKWNETYNNLDVQELHRHLKHLGR